MITWGFNAMSHDAALAVMQDDEVVYASHSERYSRVKNDKHLHSQQIIEALEYGQPDKVYYYETPWLKKYRQLKAGQYNLLLKESPRRHLANLGVHAKVKTTRHHNSHAAYGYYTSGFDAADVLVIDSIGEFETTTWWQGFGDELTKKASQIYPHSVGLWYSAMTQRIGLKPQEQEYILMGMAAAGNPGRFYQLILDDFFAQTPDHKNFNVVFKKDLHRGCLDWRPDLNTVQDYADIAAAVQCIYQDILYGLTDYISAHSSNRNIVLVGGCALNCAANIEAYHKYDHVWIPPNPGDAGSSIGAILANNPRHINFNTAFLGTDIPGAYPIDDIINDLMTTGISAVASGRAEFGPRALGNRSILADPRVFNMQERVNTLKGRESFRPFAPAILAEHAEQLFYLPTIITKEFKYMQTALSSATPTSFPAVTHLDNTSRIQTVSHGGLYQDRGFRRLLEKWHSMSSCPMLLNTSLNVKGEPMVNSRADAERWSQLNNLPVRMPK